MVFSVSEDDASEFFELLLPHLDERQQRLARGAFSQMLGHGGTAAVARASGASPEVVGRGRRELAAGAEVTDRVRRPGAGRPLAEVSQPGIAEALDALVEPGTRGDPMSPLRWTTKSTRTLAEELVRAGFTCSYALAGSLLKAMGYSLQGVAKTLEGSGHPDRDAQFRYLAGLVAEFQAAGDPTISVDTKMKQMVGRYANPGMTWRPAGDPVRALDHDFPDPDLPKAVPYGIYDLARDEGWVSVGISADTGDFAVNSIRTWLTTMGRRAYPHARRLLITADAGGSNGHRNRLFKARLAELATETGLEITVCHFPPGTSKWNRIEHRMFSHITMNWRGRPLTSYQTIVDLIGSTTTKTGLTIRAGLDHNAYETGITITDKHFKSLPIQRHEFHPDWNYTMKHNNDSN
jgi:Rhodopirellula transposase DDE domain